MLARIVPYNYSRRVVQFLGMIGYIFIDDPNKLIGVVLLGK
ncbi:MAG TPA: hypothetical protein VIL70_09440 [Chthoniobacterales bacterium]